MEDQAECSREAIANAAEVRVALAALIRHLRSAIHDLEAGRSIDPTFFHVQYGELDAALLLVLQPQP
jgi:hypothetical protein